MKKLTIFLLIIFLFSISLGCSCQKPEPQPAENTNQPEATTEQETEEEQISELYDEYKIMAGKWEGEWNNTTFGSTGASNASAEINPDGTASFTIDLDGFVFGLLNPPAKKFISKYDENGITFKSQDPLFGNLTITIKKTSDNEASVNIKATDVAAPGIESTVAIGTLTPEKLHLDYTVTFITDETALGTVDMTKVE